MSEIPFQIDSIQPEAGVSSGDLTPPQSSLREEFRAGIDSEELLRADDKLYTTPELFGEALDATESDIISSGDDSGRSQRRLKDVTSARRFVGFWGEHAESGSDVRTVLDWIAVNDRHFPRETVEDAYATEMLLTQNPHWQGFAVAARIAERSSDQ